MTDFFETLDQWEAEAQRALHFKETRYDAHRVLFLVRSLRHQLPKDSECPEKAGLLSVLKHLFSGRDLKQSLEEIDLLLKETQ